METVRALLVSRMQDHGSKIKEMAAYVGIDFDSSGRFLQLLLKEMNKFEVSSDQATHD